MSGTEAKAVNLSRDCALAFIEADDNGDGVLDWTEFKAAFRSIRGQRPGSVNALDDAELRSLFDAIDKDQSGSIDMDEYFMWSLEVANQNSAILSALFKRYDKGGEGFLDAEEFALAVEILASERLWSYRLHRP